MTAPSPAGLSPLLDQLDERTVLREALAQHHLVGNEPPFRMGGWSCSCGTGCGNGYRGYADHLAAEAALPIVEARVQAAEQRGYERGRRDFQFAPEGDNHHNARLCPYCTPDDGARVQAADNQRAGHVHGAVATRHGHPGVCCCLTQNCRATDCGLNAAKVTAALTPGADTAGATA